MNVFIYFIYIHYISIVITTVIKEYKDINLTILDQESRNYFPSLISQNYTDITHSPVIQAADDFIIPPLSTFIVNNIIDGIDECRRIYFKIGYFRLKNQHDPSNITYCLHRNFFDTQTSVNKPGLDIFCNIINTPLNSNWNTNLQESSFMYMKIDHGEKDIYGRTFSITSSFLRSHLRLWFSFYVSMPRDFFSYSTGVKENRISWILFDPSYLINDGDGGEQQHKNTDSPYKYYSSTSQYFFKDRNNLFRLGFIDWTSSTILESSTSLTGTTTQYKSSHNLMFKVDLLCKTYITKIDINTTPSLFPSPQQQQQHNNDTNKTLTPIIQTEPPINNNISKVVFSIIIPILVILLLLFILIVSIILFIISKHKKSLKQPIDLEKVVKNHSMKKGLDTSKSYNNIMIYDPLNSIVYPSVNVGNNNNNTDEHQRFVDVDTIEISLDDDNTIT